MTYNEIRQQIVDYPNVIITETKKLLVHELGNQEVIVSKTYDALPIGKLTITYDMQGDATNWYCAGSVEQIDKADGVIVTPDL